MTLRIIAIIIIFAIISAAWMILGGTMEVRTRDTESKLTPAVMQLWGSSITQTAPEFVFRWDESKKGGQASKTKTIGSKPWVFNNVYKIKSSTEVPGSSDIKVDFDLDHRRKGLLWYSTYKVDFAARYGYTHTKEHTGELTFVYRFPSSQSSYDNFSFSVNGKSASDIKIDNANGDRLIQYPMTVKKGDSVTFDISYSTRGLDSWRYRFGQNTTRVKDFTLAMSTGFSDIDFENDSLSPSSKEQTGSGWMLDWNFTDLISPADISLDMPQKLNPGPLAAKISLFAPVTLFFFFVWMFVITLLKKIDLHPINYLFLGAAFFSFHLLFSFTVDHVALIPSFIISSVVSVFLAISYLKLVAGLRFAAVEAGLAQIIYLVLFSYAHFYQGYTGLIVTVGSILTLFAIMQLTGRIDWTKKFASMSRKGKERALNSSAEATGGGK